MFKQKNKRLPGRKSGQRLADQQNELLGGVGGK